MTFKLAKIDLNYFNFNKATNMQPHEPDACNYQWIDSIQ